MKCTAPRWLQVAAGLSLIACASAESSGRKSAPGPSARGALSLPDGSARSTPAGTATGRAAGIGLPPFQSDEVFSLRITGGEVIDGTGAPRRRADVLVRKDRVAFVGAVDLRVRAERVIDARGAVVSPGFIDMHAHTDPQSYVEPALAQGVTTVVVGQDGVSPSKHIGAWLRSVDAGPARINAATLVGHGTARQVAGLGMRPSLGPKERAELAAIVEQGLDEGAFGLSTGLEYDPGRAADLAELSAAAEPVGARGGVIMSHLRSEDDDKIEASLDELIEQGRRSHAKVHVAHFKVVYGHGSERADNLLAKLAAARKEGIEVTADMYPYTASYTSIGILFPDYARGTDAKSGHREKELLTYLHDRVMKRNGPEATLFGTGELAGKTLAEAARSRGVPFERILYDLGPSGGAAAYFVMDDALQTRLLLDPFVSIGSDGGGGDPHPRSHGTFTRVIEELVEKRGALGLEEAIRKMTTLSAQTLGLSGERGCLAKGCAADIDVFVPEELHTRADFVKPNILAEGMRAVIVNGVVEREGAQATRAHGGRALRPSVARRDAQKAAQ